MAIPAFADHGMLRYPHPFDFSDRMAGEAVASAIGHFRRVCAVAFDAGRHRLMPLVRINIFEKCGMAGHTIACASPQRHPNR